MQEDDDEPGDPNESIEKELPLVLQTSEEARQ